MAIFAALGLFFNDIFQTFILFLYAPLIYSDILWILTPLVLAIGLMEFYFRKYPRSGIGHHKSLENTIFLVFILFNLLQHVITKEQSLLYFLIVGVFMIFAAVITVMDFLHKLPTKSKVHHSSKFVVVFIAYIILVLVYSDLLSRTNFWHIVSILLSVSLLFLLTVVVRKTFVALEPKSYEEIESFLNSVEKDIKKVSKTGGTSEIIDTFKPDETAPVKEETEVTVKAPKQKKTKKRNKRKKKLS